METPTPEEFSQQFGFGTSMEFRSVVDERLAELSYDEIAQAKVEARISRDKGVVVDLVSVPTNNDSLEFIRRTYSPSLVDDIQRLREPNALDFSQAATKFIGLFRASGIDVVPHIPIMPLDEGSPIIAARYIEPLVALKDADNLLQWAHSLGVLLEGDGHVAPKAQSIRLEAFKVGANGRLTLIDLDPHLRQPFPEDPNNKDECRALDMRYFALHINTMINNIRLLAAGDHTLGAELADAYYDAIEPLMIRYGIVRLNPEAEVPIDDNGHPIMNDGDFPNTAIAIRKLLYTYPAQV